MHELVHKQVLNPVSIQSSKSEFVIICHICHHIHIQNCSLVYSRSVPLQNDMTLPLLHSINDILTSFRQAAPCRAVVWCLSCVILSMHARLNESDANISHNDTSMSLGDPERSKWRELPWQHETLYRKKHHGGGGCFVFPSDWGIILFTNSMNQSTYALL